MLENEDHKKPGVQCSAQARLRTLEVQRSLRSCGYYLDICPGAAAATWAYAVAYAARVRRGKRRDLRVAGALLAGGGAAEGSYEQGAAAVGDPNPSTGNPSSWLCQFATVRYTASLHCAAF
jgi:hypothetical protein